jgi:hypothetical protein
MGRMRSRLPARTPEGRPVELDASAGRMEREAAEGAGLPLADRAFPATLHPVRATCRRARMRGQAGRHGRRWSRTGTSATSVPTCPQRLHKVPTEATLNAYDR